VFTQNLEMLGMPEKPGLIRGQAVEQFDAQFEVSFRFAYYIRQSGAVEIIQYWLDPVLNERIACRRKAQAVFTVKVQAKITDFSGAESGTHFYIFLERLGTAWKNPAGNYLPGRPHLPANFGGALLAD